MEIGITRCCLDKKVPGFSWNSQILDWTDIHKLSFTVSAQNFRTSYPQLTHLRLISTGKDRPSHMFPVTYSLPIDKEQSPWLHSEDYSDDDASNSKDSQAELLAQPLSSDELKTLLADSERVRLVRKLSEANQQNRFLKRQLQDKEATLVNFKSELALMELQVQALATLAEEISKGSIPDGSRKINGKYIQSHLHSRLEVLHEKLKEQLKDVEAARSKEVQLFWCGMAESVRVMGSFDGWSQGEYLSPEYDGSFTKFSTTLMLRPGRYEIKFLVDGEWKLSPEFPTVGEGLTENNLVVVE